MKIERVRPMVLRVTLHVYEMAALVAAARWAAEGAPGEMEPGALEQLRQVLASYDASQAALARAQEPAGPLPGP